MNKKVLLGGTLLCLGIVGGVYLRGTSTDDEANNRAKSGASQNLSQSQGSLVQNLDSRDTKQRMRDQMAGFFGSNSTIEEQWSFLEMLESNEDFQNELRQNYATLLPSLDDTEDLDNTAISGALAFLFKESPETFFAQLETCCFNVPPERQTI